MIGGFVFTTVLCIFAPTMTATPTPLQQTIVDDAEVIQKDVQKSIDAFNADLDKEELTEAPYLRFTKTPKDIITSAGNKIVLKCEAIGVPPPIIEWAYNGNVMRPEEEFNTVEKLFNTGLGTIQNSVTASKLVLPCATPNRSGEYKCLANNGYQKLETALTVSVEGNAKCVHTHLGPTISMWTDGRFERSGAAVQLFCRVDGSLQPKITWYNEENIQLNDIKKYEVLENGDLLIHSAQWEDLGVYTCVATNEYGQDRVSAFFYPTEP